ncbi:MAG: ASCH domain-containing protein [bacterium]
MLFVKYLRDAVRSGAITSSVRIWHRPHVTAGKRYRMEEGEIEVDSIAPIALDEITPDLARDSGFESVSDLLKVAKHGRGENVYLVRFHYIPRQSQAVDAPTARKTAKRQTTSRRQ